MTVAASRLEPLLRAIPELAQGELRIAPIGGGITNHNYVVSVPGSPGQVVVRVPGQDTHLLGIDRGAEVAATRSAATLGIGPEVVDFLAPDGLLVTRFLPGRVLEPADLSDVGVLERVARTLRTLHDGPSIDGMFDPVATARAYLERARERGVAPTPIALEADRVADRIVATRGLERFAPTPCHNDLLAPNLIDDGAVIRVVDWEYAAMGDPRFDLANLMANNELDEHAAATLLMAYDGRPPGERRLLELALVRVVSDFREAAWAVLQQAISVLDEDYVAYADRHFERMLTVAAQPAFEAAIRAAGSTPPDRPTARTGG
jgi:thiamine kinase-like enzyme